MKAGSNGLCSVVRKTKLNEVDYKTLTRDVGNEKQCREVNCAEMHVSKESQRILWPKENAKHRNDTFSDVLSKLIILQRLKNPPISL